VVIAIAMARRRRYDPPRAGTGERRDGRPAREGEPMKKRASRKNTKRKAKSVGDLPVAKKKTDAVKGGMAALPVDLYASTDYLSA
jgi:hypothetical protein